MLVLMLLIALVGGRAYFSWMPAFHRHKHLRWLKSSRFKKMLAFVNRVYQGIDGVACSKASFNCFNNEKTPEKNVRPVYGEFELLDFAAVLQIVNVQPHEIFYDLGSGLGKLVMTAALLTRCHKIYGIECLSELYKHSLLRLNAAIKEAPERWCRRLRRCEFIEGDYWKANFSDADVLFINATALSDEEWSLMHNRFEELKAGTRVITTSRRLNSDVFELIDARWRQASWGPVSVYIYECTP